MGLLKKTKGQVESIGLVIIVLILVFAGVFGIYLISKQEKDTSFLEDYNKMVSNNLRETVMKTHLCEGVSVEEEMNSCVVRGSSGCGMDCGEGFRNEIKRVIDGLLDKNVRYTFEMGSLGEVSSGKCESKTPSATQHLLSGIEIKVILCSV